MPVLKAAIPNQNFEVIRERIALILSDELSHQVSAFSKKELHVNVFIERSVPIDKTGLSTINVELAQGVYDNENVLSSDGTYTFNVDVFVSAKSTTAAAGDNLAAVKLQRILGACRYILKNQAYITLGFSRPFIERVTVSNISIAAPGSNDAASARMGRLAVTVRVPETSELAQTIVSTGYKVSFKVNETNDGYEVVYAA